MGYSSTSAATLVNAQNASIALFGIVGAVVLDAFLTHHGMTFFSSLFYSVGLCLLSGACYHLDSPGDHDNIASCLVGFGLFLIAIGKFSLISSAFNLSGKQASNLLTLLEYISAFFIISIILYGHVSFRMHFLFAAILMCLILVTSLLSLKSNFIMKPTNECRNPLRYMLRVYMAALLKCNLPSPQNPEDLYKGNSEHPLEHTNRKRFLEKAAIKVTSDAEEERKKWLCTVTEVEECKRLLHMVPICTAFLSYGLIKSIGDTFFLDQANDMDTTIGDKEIPLQAFLILASLSKLASKRLYKLLIWKMLRGSGKKFAPAIEYAMGMVLSTLCCVVASWIAMETFWRPSTMPRISVFWLTPQFITFGAMDGLAGEGIEGFFSKELPSSMTHYDTVFSEGIVGLGTLFTIVIVLVTNAATPWFSGEATRFDRFYHLCTVIGISIFFGFSYAAVRYYYQESQEEIQLEVESQPQEADMEAAEPIFDRTQESKAKWVKYKMLNSCSTAFSRKTNKSQASHREMKEVPEAASIMVDQLEEQTGQQQLLIGQFKDSENVSTWS